MTGGARGDQVGRGDDPVTDGGAPRERASPGRVRAVPPRRRSKVAEVVVAGHRGDAETARRALADADARVREAALGALARTGALDAPTVGTVLAADPDAAVRRRACDLAATLEDDGELTAALRRALGDQDDLVAEAACWALGERGAATSAVVDDLSDVARSHADARVREAAVAALGSLGDPRGLPAVLDALGDKPSVRRRAVVALAPFEGDDVDAALRRAASDRDWQVREVAEILLDES